MNNQISIYTEYGYMVCISFTRIKLNDTNLSFYKDDIYLFGISNIYNKLKFKFINNNCKYYDLIKRNY